MTLNCLKCVCFSLLNLNIHVCIPESTQFRRTLTVKCIFLLMYRYFQAFGQRYSSTYLLVAAENEIPPTFLCSFALKVCHLQPQLSVCSWDLKNMNGFVATYNLICTHFKWESVGLRDLSQKPELVDPVCRLWKRMMSRKLILIINQCSACINI